MRARTEIPKNCPCRRDCENRHGGCASDCEEWRRYQETRDEDYRRRAEYAESHGITISHRRHKIANIKDRQSRMRRVCR